MSVKSSSSRMRISSIALSTSASGEGRPYFARMSFSREPAFTPMRIGTPRALASRAISRTLSWYLMLPGLMRRPWMPASSAAMAYFHWKWMSAITGTVDFAAMASSAFASSQCGTATRTMSTPVATSEAICCSVALTSAVFVVVMDWTRTGASPPTSTQPTLTCRELLRWMGITILSLRRELARERLGPPGVPVRLDRQPHPVLLHGQLQGARPLRPPDVPVPPVAPGIVSGVRDLLDQEPAPPALRQDLLRGAFDVDLQHPSTLYSPMTWNMIWRSLGSSSSRNSRRCHRPSRGSPAATGIECDVADS